MNRKISEIIDASIGVKQQLLEDENLRQKIDDAIAIITTAFQNGNKVFFCGNGGSAADAQHLAAEFSGRFYKDRKALHSEALHCNTSYLTAVANDYSYDSIYSRIVEGICDEGDVLVGLTTSGNSQNIVNAFEAAKKNKVKTIALTGKSGGKLREESDILLNMPSTITPRIQEAHILVGHIICELVEENLFPDNTIGS